MNYRILGKTGLSVSEIGLGGEWLERLDTDGCKKIIGLCEDSGINILDCWMSNPEVRSNIGAGIEGKRERWYIQGHIGSTWQDGQYVRTREMDKVIPAFEDLLTRMKTDYIDLGMIHFVDSDEDFDGIISGPFIDYVRSLKAGGKIHHIGLSTHNPHIAFRAAESGEVEMLLFSVNPAFDMLPSTDKLDDYFVDEYDASLGGINTERARLYELCERLNVGITVMKGFAGGRLFNAAASPFGVALSPIQCLHYALTRPAVASVMVGFSEPEHVASAVRYCDASDAEKDYATALANAPPPRLLRSMHLLRSLRPLSLRH